MGIRSSFKDDNDSSSRTIFQVTNMKNKDRSPFEISHFLANQTPNKPDKDFPLPNDEHIKHLVQQSDDEQTPDAPDSESMNKLSCILELNMESRNSTFNYGKSESTNE